MKLVIITMRLCLIANCAGKDAQMLLGPLGIYLRDFFDRTSTGNIVLRLFIKNANKQLGIGGQYVVMMMKDEPGYVMKYNYTLAGTDHEVLQKALNSYRKAQRRIEKQFNELVQPTKYAIARMPLRGPGGKLSTVVASQQLLITKIDIFSSEGQKLLQNPPTARLREDIVLLTQQTRGWTLKNNWLDIIGPENVVITHDSGEPRIRIIDTEPYVYSYLIVVNPALKRSYYDIFLERLASLEQMVSQYSLG